MKTKMTDLMTKKNYGSEQNTGRAWTRWDSVYNR